MKSWLIYGANGYSGELIAREAAKRGMKPILAGRDREKIEALARELDLPFRVFALHDVAAIRRELEGIAFVLHCAGPFRHTSAPMVEACLAAKCHYLDITGEVPVFEAVMAQHAVAAERGVTLLPGVGFDVVPSDCLAARLAEKLPNATDLVLAFYTPGGILSRGTMKTMVEGLGEGGAIRRDGKIVRVPTLFDVKEIPFSIGSRSAMTIPWGDVSTAFHTTGIPNIRVYYSTSPKRIRRLRWSSAFLPLTRLSIVQRFLQKRADRQQGPNAAARERGKVYLYGRVSRADGSEVSATMTTPDGYALTVLSSLAIVERFLVEELPHGSFTPARLFGSHFAESLPGVEIQMRS